MDIHDWWNRTRREDGALKLSSRRLVTVLEFADEESPFKNAFREDWSDDKYIRVHTLNELKLMRTDNAAIHAQKELPANVLKSPAQLLQEEEATDHFAGIRTGIMAQLRATPITE